MKNMIMAFVISISIYGSSIAYAFNDSDLLSGNGGLVAYLDPGSGSFVYQILLAAIITGGAFFAGFWKRIVSFIRPPKRDDEQSEMDKETL